MLTKDIEINGSKYHVVYSYQALFWFADFIKRKMSDLMDFLESGDMSEREGLALMYSGLVAGAERKNRRLDVSFFDFQQIMLKDMQDGDGKLSTMLGELFQDSVEILAEEARKTEKKSAAGHQKKG